MASKNFMTYVSKRGKDYVFNASLLRGYFGRFNLDLYCYEISSSTLGLQITRLTSDTENVHMSVKNIVENIAQFK